MIGSGTSPTPREREDLIDIVRAATLVVAPAVTEEERLLLGQVIDGMLREREAPLNCD